MTQPPANTCSRCYGRQFKRTPDGRWVPCEDCFWATVSKSYIRDVIRQTDLALPPEWFDTQPWPLTDRVESGPYHDFRYRVWRSLLAYYQRRLTYDYFEAWRLTEIQFERDNEDYKSLRELKNLDLLMLVVGVADPPNSYTMPLVKYITQLRTMHGKPTWIYTRTAGAVPAVPSAPTPPPPPMPPGPPVKPRRKQIF